MSLLPTLMLTLTMAVVITVVPRIVFAWMQFRELAADENREGLQALLREENSWVGRHFVCATFGVALVVMMKTMPDLGQPEHLAAAISGYVMISFILAVAESLLAQKIAPLVTGKNTPAKLSRN